MKKSLSVASAVLAAIFLIAATAALVAVLDRALSQRMAELKEQTVALLEKAVGRKISYQSISPSVLRYMEIRNLSIYDSTNPDSVLLTIRKMRISYSLLQLLLHRDPVGSMREISIENSVFDIDVRRDSDITRLLENLLTSREGEDRLRVRFSGANVSFNVTMDGASVSLANLFFTIDSRSDALAVSFRGGANGSVGTDFGFTSSLKVQGKIGRLLDWSDLTFKVVSFSSSLLSTGGQTFQLVWKNNTIEARKIWDHSPFDMHFLADLASNVYTLNFQSEGFQPDKLLRLSGWLSKYNKWLSASITASGKVTYDLAAKNLSYSGDLDAFFPDQLPVRDVRVAGAFAGTQKRIALQQLRLTSATGNAEFTGDVLLDSFLPQGTLALSDLDVYRGERVSALISLQRSGGSLQITGREMSVGDVPFDVFDLTLAPGKDGDRFHLALSFAQESHRHSLQADGLVDIGEHPRLSLSADLADVPPDKLLQIVAGSTGSREQRNIEGFLSQFALTTRFSLTTDFSDYIISGTSVRLSKWDDPGTRLDFAFTLDRGGFSVSGFSGTWRGYTVKGDLSGQFSSRDKIAFSSGITFRDTPYSFAGTYSALAGLKVTGSYGLEVELTPDMDKVYTLLAKADRFPLPLGGGFRKISFGLEGRFPANGPWWVTCPSLAVFDLPLLQSRLNTTEMSFVLMPGTLSVPGVRFTDELSVLEGSGKATYQVEADPFDPRFLDNLDAQVTVDLKGKGSSETYAVRGGVKKGSLSVQAEFKGVPLKRVGSFALAGELTGSARVVGLVTNPAADLTVTLLNGRLGTDPIGMSAALGLAGDRLEVKNLSVSYLSHRINESTGSLELGKGAYSFTTRFQGGFFGDKVETVAHLDGQVQAASWDSFTSHFFEGAVRGRLTLSDIMVNGTAFPSWGMDVRTEGGILRFDGGPGNSIHGTFTSNKAFTLELQAPLPLIGSAEGRIIRDRIDTKLSMSAVDLRVLNPILKNPIVSFASGTASGELALAGPLNDPDYTGSLIVTDAGISCFFAKDTAGPMSTRLSFTGKTFSFPTVFASAGAARLSASGSFTIDHWVPNSFTVEIATEDQTSARLTGKFGSVRADGLASGRIKISGNEERTEVNGSMVASDCRITLGPAASGKFVPEDPPTFLTLGVELGKRVEFNWPSMEVPVVRTVAKTGNSLAITYRGDSGAYTVKGTTEIQGGEVYYFDRSFVLKSGRIVFDENQTDFDPRITVHGEIREWDAKTNEEVKIFLDADNKLSKFSPRFSSDPSRLDVDIMAMIGAPIVTRAETQGLGVSAVLLGSDIPIQFAILRPFEQKMRELLGLDTFSLRTQLIQNLIAQKLFGTAINPLDNTSLSLGWYLGNDLFVEMLMRLQSQATYPGVGSSVAGLKSEVEFNLEWATPLFLLDWTLTPQTPQSLFIPDNSISIRWRFSY